MWLSGLLPRGTVVHCTEEYRYYMSLGHVGYAAGLACPLVCKELPNEDTAHLLLDIGLRELDCFNWMVVLATDDFEVVPTRPVSPLAQFLENNHKLADNIGVVFTQTGKVRSMEEHAAKNAFWTIGVQHLKKLVALRNLEPTGTEDLFNMVALLVDDILEPTPEQFAEIMALRVGSCSPESEEVTVECLEPCMKPTIPE